ncbi:MAG: flagellar hook-basal body protein [Oscillospiraceae bacterium]|nr:flagellar hook-basal body protein [Oscillospiraceae bacterium]
MATGFYTAASGMLTQQRTINVTANNMANASTPGFKTERVVSTTFQQQLLMRQEGYQKTNIGKGDAVRVIEDVPTQFDSSYITETYNPFDFAIQGEGYFNVVDEGGTTYLTRNGGFNIDEEGYLILAGAGRVQGLKGDILVEGSDFTVNSDGNVFNSKGVMVDTLKITGVAEGTQLEKFANGLYQVPGAGGDIGITAGLYQVATPNIGQGMLEGSNTDYNRELTLLISTQRNFQSCSKILQMIDEVDQKTAAIASL